MIPSRDRLIFALDVPTAAEARTWVDRLGDSVRFYKIGMELLTSGDYFRVLDELAGRGKQVFVDLKFHDVPATDVVDAVWVRPELVGEIEFGEWTRTGVARHPRWRGLRPDKRPEDVVLET